MFLKKQKGSVIFETLIIPLLFVGFFSILISFYKYEVLSGKFSLLSSSISKFHLVSSLTSEDPIRTLTPWITGMSASSVSRLTISSSGIKNIKDKNGLSCTSGKNEKQSNQKLYLFLKDNNLKNIQFMIICSKVSNPLFPEIKVRTVRVKEK